jgi:hypothetical protein
MELSVVTENNLIVFVVEDFIRLDFIKEYLLVGEEDKEVN